MDAQYDMIVRTNLMQVMGLDIHFSMQTILWEGYKLPMKNCSKVLDPAWVEANYHMAVHPPVLKEAELCQSSILDANYIVPLSCLATMTLSILLDHAK